MKKYLLLLLCLMSSLMALAKSGTCGPNLTWELEGGILVISGTGAMTNYSSISDVPWHSSGSTISIAVIGEGVTSIGKYAFDGCSGLTAITIPNSVTSIEDYAFSGCSGLTSVNITDLASWCNIDFGGSYANPTYFAHKLVLNGTEIKDLVIPEGVTAIKGHAFRDCSGLTSVTIPNSVTSIGNSAFSSCSRLTSITMPNSVTSIGNSAFRWCSRLTSATIPNSVKSIGDEAFLTCYSLTSITIPNSVTSIGDEAFQYCRGLTSINVLAATPPTCGSDILDDAGTSTIHVIEGLADSYKAASGWKYYTFIDDIPVTCVTNITLDATGYQCAVSQIFTPQVVSYEPVDATFKEVTWSSSDPSTLTIVPSTGACIGLKDGIVTITATAKDAGHAIATATVYVGNVNPEDAVTISASSANAEMGTVSGGGTFLPGTTVTLTATPNSGYVFLNWSDGSSENPYTFTATENKELIANFRVSPEILSKTKATTLKLNQWYVITQNRNGESPAYEDVANSRVMRAATSVDVQVGDYFGDVKNFLVRLLPTENDGIYKLQWGTDHYWFTTSNTSYGAAGITVQTVTDEANAGNYFVYNINGQEGHFGINLTTDNSTYGLIVDNNGAGYTVSLWGTGKVNNINGNNDWSFYEVEISETSEVEITATCETEHGSISGSGIYERNTEVTLTAAPAEGYKFIRWSDGSTDNPYTFIATKDMALTAEFKLIQMTLTDGTAYTNSIEDTYDYVTYTRTFSEKNAGRWQVWYVPFDLDPAEYADDFTFARIYMMAYVDPNTRTLVSDPAQGELSVVLKYLEEGELVKAGTPYVVKARQAGEQTFEAVDGVLHAASENHTIASSTTSEIFTFSGNYESVTCPAGWYAIAASGGFIAAENKTLSPYRWHFEVTPTGYGSSVQPAAVANARMYVMDEDNRLLTSVMNMQAQADSYRTYDMQGRLLKGRDAQHGISIRNGRKYVR